LTVVYVVGSERYELPDGDGEITFTATPELFERLRSGSLDPAVAFMQGKLKMAGDMATFYDLLPDIPVP
jgi:putative sterol carrier protein